jgi:hypothetical protein
MIQFIWCIDRIRIWYVVMRRFREFRRIGSLMKFAGLSVARLSRASPPATTRSHE